MDAWLLHLALAGATMSIGLHVRTVTRISNNVYQVEATHVGIFRRRERTFLFHDGHTEDLLFEVPGYRECSFGLMLKVRNVVRVSIAGGLVVKEAT